MAIDASLGSVMLAMESPQALQNRPWNQSLINGLNACAATANVVKELSQLLAGKPEEKHAPLTAHTVQKH